eukprot:TRINITY_DN2532_c0_g1_i2.p1 TRINITY_DN2532_c0_g1~~TRINITY_DN2532_c0_g1_i2.p1  ORF type:complete len:353 (-),score=62.25 TRINITY_DN2532_c0_g1_i2:34-1038(-)
MGEQLWRTTGVHTGQVDFLRVCPAVGSPYSGTILTCSQDGSSVILRLTDGQRVQTPLPDNKGPGGWKVDWSLDGNVIYAATGGHLKKQLLSGGQAQNLSSGSIYAVALSPISQFLAVSNRAAVEFWTVSERPDAQPEPFYTCDLGSVGSIFSVHWHPNQLRVVVGSGSGALLLLELNTGARKANLLTTNMLHSAWIKTAFFNRDGTCILTSSFDGSVAIAHAETLQQIKRFHTSASGGRSAQFLPGERQIVSCGDDKLIKIWDVESEALLKTISCRSSATSLAVVPSYPWDDIRPLREMCVSMAASRGLDSKLWPQHLRDEVKRHPSVLRGQQR